MKSLKVTYDMELPDNIPIPKMIQDLNLDLESIKSSQKHRKEKKLKREKRRKSLQDIMDKTQKIDRENIEIGGCLPSSPSKLCVAISSPSSNNHNSSPLPPNSLSAFSLTTNTEEQRENILLGPMSPSVGLFDFFIIR